VSWNTGAGGYDFGSGAVPVLSTAASLTDLVSFRYSAAKQKWLCLNSGGLGYLWPSLMSRARRPTTASATAPAWPSRSPRE
jgi:hypothetical protein